MKKNKVKYSKYCNRSRRQYNVPVDILSQEPDGIPQITDPSPILSALYPSPHKQKHKYHPIPHWLKRHKIEYCECKYLKSFSLN